MGFQEILIKRSASSSVTLSITLLQHSPIKISHIIHCHFFNNRLPIQFNHFFLLIKLGFYLFIFFSYTQTPPNLQPLILDLLKLPSTSQSLEILAFNFLIWKLEIHLNHLSTSFGSKLILHYTQIHFYVEIINLLLRKLIIHYTHIYLYARMMGNKLKVCLEI
jgi:hypothetical protein